MFYNVAEDKRYSSTKQISDTNEFLLKRRRATES